MLRAASRLARVTALTRPRSRLTTRTRTRYAYASHAAASSLQAQPTCSTSTLQPYSYTGYTIYHAPRRRAFLSAQKDLFSIFQIPVTVFS